MEVIGTPFPIVKTAKGFLSPIKGNNKLKADLLMLLMTGFGERPMLPNFCTNLKELLFEPNNDLLIEKAKNTIAQAIATWEPRVVVVSINVTNGIKDESYTDDYAAAKNEQENVLGIQIEFIDPTNIKNVEVLTLKLPLEA